MIGFIRDWINYWGGMFWVCFILFVPFIVVLLVINVGTILSLWFGG